MRCCSVVTLFADSTGSFTDVMLPTGDYFNSFVLTLQVDVADSFESSVSVMVRPTVTGPAPESECLPARGRATWGG